MLQFKTELNKLDIINYLDKTIKREMENTRLYEKLHRTIEMLQSQGKLNLAKKMKCYFNDNFKYLNKE